MIPNGECQETVQFILGVASKFWRCVICVKTPNTCESEVDAPDQILGPAVLKLDSEPFGPNLANLRFFELWNDFGGKPHPYG